MQNTRLVNLLNTITGRIWQWFSNPWRRFSLLVISFLFGFFLGTATSTTAGQKAQLDIVVAGFLVLFTEVTSRIFYSRTWTGKTTIWIESVNILKVGFTYSLFVEAFKLGS
jgi:hypothetical protein